jgi:hypothetical protein
LVEVSVVQWLELAYEPVDCRRGRQNCFFVADNQERQEIRDYGRVSETCQFFDYFFAAER